jgi:hypothetical protein
MGLQKYRADRVGETQSNGAVPWFTDWMGGPTLALIRNCPIQNRPEVSPRTVYITGIADTYFSIPAACRVRGKVIKGWVGCEDGEYYFRAYKEN